MTTGKWERWTDELPFLIHNYDFVITIKVTRFSFEISIDFVKFEMFFNFIKFG